MIKHAIFLAVCAALLIGHSAYSDDGFRDLNKNGRLDIYEDPAASVDARIEDLIERMTLAEKAGLMFIYGSTVNDDASIEYREGGSPERLNAKHNIELHKLNHFNLWNVPEDVSQLAIWQNNLQRFAEQNTRLGIPVTIASDPRHHFSENIFSFESSGFSQFPETLGLAAIGDLTLIERFAEVVRKEYVAVGIRLALHPQVDLATEPRWPRISGGFGDDADLSARIAERYVTGLQGDRLTHSSVATMTKHFPGGGPQNEGLDPHFEFQLGQVYPGDNFAYHLTPFVAAINAGTAAIMPYYGVPVGQTGNDVAMAFNKEIIGDLLRRDLQFTGVVCADWGVISDLDMGDVIWPARAWGVEHLSEEQRVKAALDAGIDQFGGERCPEHIVSLVEKGEVSEIRIDESARRILQMKFELGLFDDPFVSVSDVPQLVGTPAARTLGMESQMRAMTLLKNSVAGGVGGARTLPIKQDQFKVYVHGMDATAIERFADIADAVNDADLAIVRVDTPWYPVDTANRFAQGFHHGDLDFKGAAREELFQIIDAVPTIVVIYLDRPAVIPGIAANAAAVIAEYGASDHAVARVLFGEFRPQGRLPFELPSSMSAVEKQLADLPSDSENPLFEAGFGMRYE